MYVQNKVKIYMFFFTACFITLAQSSYQRFSEPIDVLKLISPFLPDNPTVLEAGAYNGTESIKLAQFWPHGTLYTFEPVPELYHNLVKKVHGFSNIHTYQYALSDKVGVAKFYVSEDGTQPGRPSQSSSLLAPKEHIALVPWITFKREIAVATLTIDEWARKNNVQKIDFMWLDMQGNEVNTLLASPNILKTVKVILTEVEFVEAYKGQYLFKEVKELLEEQGFTLFATNFDLQNPSWFGDALFVRAAE